MRMCILGPLTHSPEAMAELPIGRLHLLFSHRYPDAIVYRVIAPLDPKACTCPIGFQAVLGPARGADRT